MNVPNMLTVVRIFLTIIFAMVTQAAGSAGAWASLIVFCVAALTDWADGYIARKYNLMTAFGKIMDPVADKVLTLTALFIFAFEGIIALWMVALVAVREIVVTAVRIHALTVGRVIPAESAGKVKTVFQMMAVFLVLAYRLCAVVGPTQGFIKKHQFELLSGINGIMIAAVILTIWSGVSFFRNLKDKR